jgi:hypothetical protein
MVSEIGDVVENPEAEDEAGAGQGVAISAHQIIRNL